MWLRCHALPDSSPRLREQQVLPCPPRRWCSPNIPCSPASTCAIWRLAPTHAINRRNL